MIVTVQELNALGVYVRVSIIGSDLIWGRVDFECRLTA